MDFSELRDRIARSHAAVDRHLVRSPEAAAALKRARADAAAAVPPEAAKRTKASLEALVFLVGTELAAVPAAAVEGVVRREGTHQLPLLPPHIPFVLAFRGEAVPAASLHVLQGGAVPAPAPLQRFIVVRGRSGRAALLADEARSVSRIDREQLVEQAEDAWLAREALQGITPEGIALLDVDGLLDALAGASRTEEP